MNIIDKPIDNYKKLLGRLWVHINPIRRFQLALLFVLMILASFAEVLSIGAVLPFLAALTSPENIFGHPLAQPLINLLNLTKPEQLLLPLTVAFSIAALLSGAMRLILLWVQTRLGHAIGADFSFSIYRRTLYQPYSVHVTRNSSEIIAGITNKASQVISNVLLPLATVVSSMLMLLAILMALVAIEPEVAFKSFIGIGSIYILVILTTRKILLRDSKRINYETGKVIRSLQEGLGGIRDVLIDGTQSTYWGIFRGSDLPLRRALANVQIISGVPRFVIEALGMILIASLAYSLASKPAGIANAIPILGALALGAQRLLPVLQSAYANWTLMRGAQAQLNAALELLEQPLPIFEDETSHPFMPFKDNITLNNLSFRYTKNSPWVIKPGFNLKISKGSRVGFIGSTGSGKSTLVDIIMGLLNPDSGSLIIDDKAITDKNYRSWQAHIAHVPQAIFLSDTTITENIAFGIPADDIDHARVSEAARKAHIAETIESWDDQYNTVVGERGVRLSGGQRQRIGIARALYKKVDVIILDEATSALDNETERSVIKSI